MKTCNNKVSSRDWLLQYFRLAELRALEVPSDLSERIRKQNDTLTPAKIAKRLGCHVDMVKAVLAREIGGAV